MAEFSILHLQLNLVHPQLVEEPLRLFSCSGRVRCSGILSKPLFRQASQLGTINGLYFFLSHGMTSVLSILNLYVQDTESRSYISATTNTILKAFTANSNGFRQ